MLSLIAECFDFRASYSISCVFSSETSSTAASVMSTGILYFDKLEIGIRMYACMYTSLEKKMVYWRIEEFYVYPGCWRKLH